MEEMYFFAAKSSVGLEVLKHSFYTFWPPSPPLTPEGAEVDRDF